MPEKAPIETPTGRGGGPVKVAVLLPDPRLPYSFAPGGWLGEVDVEAARCVEEALISLDGYDATILDDHPRMIDQLRAGVFDIALNFCDTGFHNEDFISNVPSLCEILRVPVTGSSAVAIDTCGDKFLVSALADRMGIPVPREYLVDLTTRPFQLPDDYPVLIKPNVGGGSYGVTRNCVVYDEKEAQEYLDWMADNISPPEAVVQEFLTGRELTVSVIGNPETGLEILPPAEIDYSGLDTDLPPIFTYGAKFDPQSRYYEQLEHFRSELDADTLEWISRTCQLLFERLRCRDYARIDFRAGKDGRLRLLDPNPNPTWHHDGRLAKSAEWAGYSYADLLRKILEAGLSRYR